MLSIPYLKFYDVKTLRQDKQTDATPMMALTRLTLPAVCCCETLDSRVKCVHKIFTSINEPPKTFRLLKFLYYQLVTSLSLLKNLESP